MSWASQVYERLTEVSQEAKRWQRVKRWAVVALYSAFIFATLPYGPQIVKLIRKSIGLKGLGYSLNACVLTIVALFLLYLLFYRKERRVSSYLLFASIGLTYGYFLEALHNPAERFHFVEYGLLSWLVHFALKLDVYDKSIYLWAAVAVSLIGALDEIVQWILPNRYFGWGDIGINGLAGILGQGMIWLVTRR